MMDPGKNEDWQQIYREKVSVRDEEHDDDSEEAGRVHKIIRCVRISHFSTMLPQSNKLQNPSQWKYLGNKSWLCLSTLFYIKNK